MPVRTTLLTRENKIPIYPRSDLSQIIDVKTGKDLKTIIADLRKEIAEGTTDVLDRYDEVWASALNDLDTRLHQVVDVYEEIWAAALTALNTRISDVEDDINQTLENVFLRLEALENKEVYTTTEVDDKISYTLEESKRYANQQIDGMWLGLNPYSDKHILSLYNRNDEEIDTLTFSLATDTVAGLLSPENKKKLDRLSSTGGNPDIEIEDGGGGGIAPNPDEEVEEIAP